MKEQVAEFVMYQHLPQGIMSKQRLLGGAGNDWFYEFCIGHVTSNAVMVFMKA